MNQQNKPDGIKVAYYQNNQRTEGTLTTEHAASNYGLPVFVDDQGEARGSAEVCALIVVGRRGVPDGCSVDASGYCDATDFYQRATQAGFTFEA